MQIGELYQLVLLLVLVGLILGVGVLTLGKFENTSGVTTKAGAALNSTIDALTPIASSWLPLIVTVAVLAIIMVIVIRSFGQFSR